MKTTIYSPAPILQNPRLLFREMFSDLMAGRELAWRLMVRNLSAMYRQTFLGYIWAFMPPLFAASTFILLRKGGILQTAETAIPYAAWTLIGTFLWQTFNEAFTSPMRMVSSSLGMLTKINFPREALILAGIGEVIVNFFIRLIIVAVVLIAFKIMPTWQILFFPLALLSLICFGVMLGVLLTPIALLYKDIEKTIPLLLPFLMVLSGPVIPLPKEGIGHLLATFNPIYPLLELCRDLLTGQPPDTWMIALWITAAELVLLFIGWILYRISMPHLIARMGG